MPTSKSAAALRSVLKNHTASEIETSGKVIEIDSSVKPLEAAQVLWKNNILGAPVYDSSQKKYLGFFDMRDTLSAVVASHKEVKHTSSHEIMTKWFDDMNVTVTYLAARNPFVSCYPDTSLERVFKMLSEQKCHRIPILNKEGRCESIISQSALVKALAEHVDSKELEETLEEAGLEYKKEIVSVKDTDCARDVFELLDGKRLSGIAVVDSETGKLVGNTSARDIKLAVVDTTTSGETNTMDMDILSYLAAVRQATPQKKERHPSAHIATDSTVGHAIRLLAKTGYHRVFVVDEENKPVGVISVADVVKFVVKNDE